MIEQILSFITQEHLAITIFFSTLVAFILLKKVIMFRLHKLAEKTENNFDDLFVSLLKSVGWLFALVFALILATFFTEILSLQDTPWLNVIIILVVTYQIGRFVNVLFKWIQEEMADSGTQIISSFKTILIIIIWAIGAVTIFSALGYDVTSLIAGLGIGGLAIALALQNILGDAFSSISIFFDKPFSVGDHIQVNGKDGTVEKIGLKTTRMRSPRGEMIVIANQELTNAVVQNFGALERRRVVMEIGLEYETPNEKIEQMRIDVRKMIEEKEGMSFGRFFFKSFGDSALTLELVFYIDSDQYDDYVNAQHDLNLMIKKYSENQNINMAFPTQTVYLKK